MKTIQGFTLLLLLLVSEAHSKCLRRHPPIKSKWRGNLTIIGLFPVFNDYSFDDTVMMWIETAKFAIERGNRYLRRRNIPLVIDYKMFDTCKDEAVVSELIMTILIDSEEGMLHEHTISRQCCDHVSQHPLLGIIGPSFSTNAIRASNLLSYDQIPLMSYSATSPRLSDKKKYPFFFRTIPSDNYQAHAIVQLLKEFSWSFVSLVVFDDEYGDKGRQFMFEVFRANNICVDVDERVTEDMKKIDEVLIKLNSSSTSNVTILWLYENTLKKIFPRAELLQLRGRVWIATDGIGTSPFVLTVDSSIIGDFFVVTPYSGSYKKFNKKFWNMSVSPSENSEWIHNLFASNKSFLGRTLADHRHRFIPDAVGNVRNSVWAYFKALKNYVKGESLCIESRCFMEKWNSETFTLDYLAKVKFTGLANETISFDGNGDIKNPIYSINMIQRHNGFLHYKNVAQWSSAGVDWLADFKWYDTKTPKSQCGKICEPGEIDCLLFLSSTSRIM